MNGSVRAILGNFPTWECSISFARCGFCQFCSVCATTSCSIAHVPAIDVVPAPRILRSGHQRRYLVLSLLLFVCSIHDFDFEISPGAFGNSPGCGGKNG